jgi:hypothetical protein
MSAIAGHTWTTWNQIDDVLGLAVNRATARYIDAMDQPGDSAHIWQRIAHDLAEARKVTAAHVAAGDGVSAFIVQDSLYVQIDRALTPMLSDGDVWAAIEDLPVVVPGVESDNDIDLSISGENGEASGGTNPLITVAVIGGLGLLAYIFFDLVRKH